MQNIQFPDAPFAQKLEPIEGKTWVCTDIHGCSATFKNLTRAISLRKEDRLLILGDMIRRGPDSLGVLAHIRDLKNAGYDLRLLKGNHESLFLSGLMVRSAFPFKFKDTPRWVLDLTRNLPLYFYNEAFLFAHAGFDFARENPFDENERIYWISKFEVLPENTGGRRVVHGHTPTNLEVIQQAVREKHYKIPLDNGCVYAAEEGFGTLSAFCADDFTLLSIPYAEEAKPRAYRGRKKVK